MVYKTKSMRCALFLILFPLTIWAQEKYDVEGYQEFGIQTNSHYKSSTIVEFSFPYYSNGISHSYFVNEKVYSNFPIILSPGLAIFGKKWYGKVNSLITFGQAGAEGGGGIRKMFKWIGFRLGLKGSFVNFSNEVGNIPNYYETVKIGNTIFNPTFQYTYTEGEGEDEVQHTETVNAEKVNISFHQTYLAAAPEFSLDFKLDPKVMLQMGLSLNTFRRSSNYVKFSQSGESTKDEEVTGESVQIKYSNDLFNKVNQEENLSHPKGKYLSLHFALDFKL